MRRSKLIHNLMFQIKYQRENHKSRRVFLVSQIQLWKTQTSSMIYPVDSIFACNPLFFDAFPRLRDPFNEKLMSHRYFSKRNKRFCDNFSDPISHVRGKSAILECFSTFQILYPLKKIIRRFSLLHKYHQWTIQDSSTISHVSLTFSMRISPLFGKFENLKQFMKEYSKIYR